MHKPTRMAASAMLAVALVLLSACQSVDNPQNRPRQIDYDLYGYFKSLPRDFPEARKYHASDGAMLTFDGYRYGRKNPVALIYLHGLSGHAGWGRQLAVKLADRNYDVFALDRRGSGHSKGINKTITGQPPGFEDLVSDVHAFLKPLKGYYDSVYLIGDGWGARLAVAYGIAYRGESNGFVLISPMIIGNRLPAFQPSDLVSDPQLQQQLANDPLVREHLDDNFVQQSKRMGDFIRRYIKRINRPLQVFLASDDPLVDDDKVLNLLEKGSAPSLDVQLVSGARHELALENPDRVARDIDHWIRYQESSRNGGKAR